MRPDKLLCTADEEEEMESLKLMPSVQVFSRKGLGKRRGKNSVYPSVCLSVVVVAATS